MKVFYWNDVVSLENASTGMAFAYAETKTQAIELILDKYKEDYKYDLEPKATLREETLNEIEELRKELNETKPKIIEKPEGVYDWGCD